MKHWNPSKPILKSTNIYKMMQTFGFTSYDEFWKWSVEKKETFWRETVANLEIIQEVKYKEIVNISQGVEKAKWLYGAKMNIVDSCFQNKENGTAIICQDENGDLLKISQKQLEALVDKTANGLLAEGLQLGDVVAIYMPMTLEAVTLYLAAIKAGLVVATIADSFSEEEIKVRLEITQPKLICTQDVFMRGAKKHELYTKIKKTTSIKIVVVDTVKDSIEKSEEDVYWKDFLSSNAQFTSVKRNPSAAMTILFSSGTTGAPKAIPWNHTTAIKSASDAYYHHDIHKNDVLCWPTNLGWMMGPWLVFAAFINKATIALYAGSPMESEFGKFVEEAKVTMLGVVPSIVKQWRASNQMSFYNWEAIKCFSSTGEVSNPEDMSYLMSLGNHKPIIEYCGGTEIGGGYIASTLVQENIPSQFSSQTLGSEFVLLDSEGKEAKEGEVFLIPPIMGLSTTLLNKDHYKTYYEGVPNYQGRILRRHGDELQIVSNGYYKANGRVDDAMNLGGIKVSSVQIEALLNGLDFVTESAAIAVAPEEGGPSSLVVYYVEALEISKEEALNKVQKYIKTELNPLFKVVDLVKINNLPRTASNKIKRKELRLLYKSKNQ
ncbi:AMP-binding protein [Flavicella sediminum]|uniref:AMP-binding protein n=1 Tax=Flavicella sediminum TaxID=2585141 RepID=UPI00111DD71F|nr:AMP-binding protein [Flavicella sediminum]